MSGRVLGIAGGALLALSLLMAAATPLVANATGQVVPGPRAGQPIPPNAGGGPAGPGARHPRLFPR